MRLDTVAHLHTSTQILNRRLAATDTTPSLQSDVSQLDPLSPTPNVRCVLIPISSYATSCSVIKLVHIFHITQYT